jgi:hypothetical protein
LISWWLMKISAALFCNTLFMMKGGFGLLFYWYGRRALLSIAAKVVRFIDLPQRFNN